MRHGCAAVHNGIIIFARFVAGKLHRCGGFAVAGRAARCQRRGGGISAGYGKINRGKIAGVVSLVIAVVLFAEHIQGIGSVCKAGRNGNIHGSVFCVRQRHSAIVQRFAALLDDDGDIFICSGGRPDVIQRKGIAGLAAGSCF